MTRRLLILLLDVALAISSTVAIIILWALLRDRREAHRIEDVQTLLGVISPRKNF